MTDNHKAVAEALLTVVADSVGEVPASSTDVALTTQVASAHALIAIAEQLGEVVEQLRDANTVAAFDASAIRGSADYEQERATVRGLLRPTTEGERA